ncbi:MAG: hypothetical protein IPG45_07175 [Deltaproteobacteria bacterium]|jgi:hypothetical protein|nr:hypothetical protein [Deltaproteobacteria bacterium]
MEVRIWSVYDRDDRLVLILSDEPGDFNFTRIPDEDCDPVECEYATIQCYRSTIEPDVLNAVFRSTEVEELLQRLKKGGYKVRNGRPTPARFARL